MKEKSKFALHRRGMQVVSFDESRVMSTQIDDIAMDKIEYYFRQTTGKRLEDFDIDKLRLLEGKGIIAPSENNEYYVTVAGILLFGKEPQRFLPQS